MPKIIHYEVPPGNGNLCSQSFRQTFRKDDIGQKKMHASEFRPKKEIP